MYKILTWKQASNLVNFHHYDLEPGQEMEFLTLASTPHAEKCTQAGGSYKLQIIECTAYINQLQRIHGEPPPDCQFFILENFHEFGTYYEAAIFYTTTEEGESRPEIYAYDCEIGPETWDEESRNELRENGHPDFQPAKAIKIKAA